MKKYTKVKIKDLIPNPNNLRTEYEDIEGLAASILAVGMIQPITGKLTKDKQLHIVAGHRRRSALLHLVEEGHYTMDSEIDVLGETAAEDEQQSTAAMLIENMQRADLAPMDESDGVMRLVADYGMKEKEIAEHLGVSLKWVKDRVALSEVADTPVGDQLTEGSMPIEHAVMFANLPEDRREKLTKGDKVPSRFDIENQYNQQRSEDGAAKTLRKLKKDGLLATTDQEAKRIAKADYADLTSDPDAMSIKTIFGAATEFAANLWNPGPGTWLDKTVIARHHKDALTAIDEYIETHGKGIVIVAVKVNGYYEWQQWKSVTVAGDGSTDEALTDQEKMEELVDQKNAEAIDKWKAKVQAVRFKYIEETKTAELMRAYILLKLEKDTSWTIPDEVFDFIGGERADDRATNQEMIATFATKNAANLARVAMLLATDRVSDLEQLVNVPARPSMSEVDYDQYDEAGAYIHPSDQEEVA